MNITRTRVPVGRCNDGKICYETERIRHMTYFIVLQLFPRQQYHDQMPQQEVPDNEMRHLWLRQGDIKCKACADYIHG